MSFRAVFQHDWLSLDQGVTPQLYYVLLDLGEAAAEGTALYVQRVRLPAEFRLLTDAYWLLDHASGAAAVAMMDVRAA